VVKVFLFRFIRVKSKQPNHQIQQNQDFFITFSRIAVLPNTPFLKSGNLPHPPPLPPGEAEGEGLTATLRKSWVYAGCPTSLPYTWKAARRQFRKAAGMI
jgi:hypothetical protein